MTTKRVEITDLVYTQINTNADFAILNTDKEYQRMIVSDTQPAPDDDNFMIIRNNCGLTSNSIKGTVWALSGISGSSFVHVTE